jgi:hypothetical protein
MNNPLYFTEPKLLGGVFTLQDSVGFPISITIDMCKENNVNIDWFEALSDCWLNDCLKFDNFVHQIQQQTGIECLEDKWKIANIAIINKYPRILSHDLPINVVCRYTLAKKRLNALRYKEQCVRTEKMIRNAWKCYLKMITLSEYIERQSSIKHILSLNKNKTKRNFKLAHRQLSGSY